MKKDLATCPGCDLVYDYNLAALSRLDNKTHICSACGQIEAAWQLNSQTLTTFGLKNISEMRRDLLALTRSGK